MFVLYNSSSEINAIHLIFAKELGLPIRLIDIKAQKIDNTILDTYKMVVAVFLMTKKTNLIKIFKEIFLVTNISLEVVLRMFFHIFSGRNIDILGWKLW